MNNYEILNQDKELNTIIDSINEINKNNLLACHGRYHTNFVINTVELLLTKLGLKKDIVELGKIAALLHDIGTINGKKDHAHRSSEMCIPFLEKTTLTKEQKAIIIHAIDDHSKGNEITNPIGAALILADKINLTKDRILDLGKQDPWHQNILNIDKIIVTVENKNIIINYITNENFSIDIMFKGWKKGLTEPIKASHYFNRDCIFQVNGNTINISETN